MKTLGKSSINRRQKLDRLLPVALLEQQPRQIARRAQLERRRLLPSRDFQCEAKVRRRFGALGQVDVQ